MKLAIFGTGGHAKSVYDIVKNKKIYFFDKNKKILEINKKKFKVIGNHKSLITYKKKISKVIVTIGNNEVRRKYYKEK